MSAVARANDDRTHVLKRAVSSNIVMNSDEVPLQTVGDYEDDVSVEPREHRKPQPLSQLRGKDLSSFLLLIVLFTTASAKFSVYYILTAIIKDMLQGVPVGLTFGSIPFLLKEKMTYSQLAIFSLAGYPYSLKLLWSPIVDSTYFKSIGRRKSWIIPIQLVTGLLFWWMGTRAEYFLSGDVNVYYITAIFVAAIFLSATQDIAVDGWALTLLSKENLTYASTSQTVGINTGYFMSFTVFLALNSAEFSNKYLRSIPAEVGVLPLGGYLKFWAVLYVLVTLWLIFCQHEDATKAQEDLGIIPVYKTIVNIIRLPHMIKFIGVLLLAKIGFIANEAATGLKLLEKGLSKEDLALTVLIDFPFQILFGYYAAKWSSGPRPLKPWLLAFYGRLFFAAVGMIVVYIYPTGGVTNSYFGLVMVMMVLNSFTSTVQFVSMGTFFNAIADPVIGGTYMTLLNTFSNFGGTWPRFFVLEAVDYFTNAVCSKQAIKSEVLQCSNSTGRQQCKDIGGECNVLVDGYYRVGIISVLLGLCLLFGYIRPEILKTESLPLKSWRLPHPKFRG